MLFVILLLVDKFVVGEVVVCNIWMIFCFFFLSFVNICFDVVSCDVVGFGDVIKEIGCIVVVCVDDDGCIVVEFFFKVDVIGGVIIEVNKEEVEVVVDFVVWDVVMRFLERYWLRIWSMWIVLFFESVFWWLFFFCFKLGILFWLWFIVYLF